MSLVVSIPISTGMEVFDSGVISINSAVEALTTMFNVLMLKRGLQSTPVPVSHQRIESILNKYNNNHLVPVDGYVLDISRTNSKYVVMLTITDVGLVKNIYGVWLLLIVRPRR